MGLPQYSNHFTQSRLKAFPVAPDVRGMKQEKKNKPAQPKTPMKK